MKFDWGKIRAEYISTGISQREIAKKYGVSPAQIARRASNEGWAESRTKFESTTTAKAEQKLVEKRSDELADLFGTIAEAGTNVAKLLLDESKKRKNFIRRASKEDNRMVLNAKTALDISGALMNLVNVLRDVTENPNAVERARMEKDDTGAPVRVQIEYVPPEEQEAPEPETDAEQDGEPA